MSLTQINIFHSNILFKGIFCSILILPLLSLVSARCPCGTDTLEQNIITAVKTLEPQKFEVVLNDIDSQFVCRKKLGIMINYCSEPYYLLVSQKQVDSLSMNEYSLLLSYRKRCFEFQKKLDFPLNLENDSILLNLSLKQDLSKREFAYQKFLSKQSLDMRLIIDDDSDEYKNNKWKELVDITHLPDYYNKPLNGKYFFIAGAAYLTAGTLGTMYANKHCRTYRPPENFYHEYDQIRNAVVWGLSIVADIVSPILLLAGVDREIKYKMHIREKKCCPIKIAGCSP